MLKRFYETKLATFPHREQLLREKKRPHSVRYLIDRAKGIRVGDRPPHPRYTHGMSTTASLCLPSTLMVSGAGRCTCLTCGVSYTAGKALRTSCL